MVGGYMKYVLVPVLLTTVFIPGCLFKNPLISHRPYILHTSSPATGFDKVLDEAIGDVKLPPKDQIFLPDNVEEEIIIDYNDEEFVYDPETGNVVAKSVTKASTRRLVPV